MNAFPAYFPLSGRRVVIVGSGEGAEAKARLFVGAPCELSRVGEHAAADPQTYAGAVLAFIAIPDKALAERAAAMARAAHVPVNVTDRPDLCDFYTPAVIDRGEVVAAIGTGGSAPILASLLRSDIEARVPAGAGRLAALLGRMQGEVRQAFPDVAIRRAFLRAALSGPAAEAALAGRIDEAQALLTQAMQQFEAPQGRVRFVDGRGPVASVTLGAARVLSEAEVVIADGDADPQVVALARRDARRFPVGQNATELATLAGQGLQVVRVTGSVDASVEIAALKAAGVFAAF